METSQIQAPTPKNTYGFKIGSQEMAQVKSLDEVTVVWGFPSFTFSFSMPIHREQCGSRFLLSTFNCLIL